MKINQDKGHNHVTRY